MTGEPGRSAEGKNPLNNVYFGEQHLHTSASPDAFAFGTRNDANAAYRYAKGEAIKEDQSGKMIQKRTPYDWAQVTDHAEYSVVSPDNWCKLLFDCSLHQLFQGLLKALSLGNRNRLSFQRRSRSWIKIGPS
jgi:hypothetical protein